MKPLIVRYSRWYFVLLPLALLFFASAPFMMLHEVKHPKGWDYFGMIAYSGGAILVGRSLILMFLRKPLIILNDEGLFAEDLAVGVIPWKDIEQVFVHERGWWKNRVELLLRNPEVYQKRRPWLQRIFTFDEPEFILSLKGADTSPETLVADASQRLFQQSFLDN